MTLTQRFNYKKALFAISIMTIGICFWQCKSDSEKYEKTSSGIEFKYHRKGDGGKKVSINDYLILHVKYYDPFDSLLFTTQSLSGQFRMRYIKQSNKGDINEALGMLTVGDSVSFKLDTKTFFTETLKDSCPKKYVGKKMRFEIALIDIQDSIVVKQLKEELVNRQKEKEQVLLEDFLNQYYPDQKPQANGLYVIPLKTGKGKSPVNGKKVTIHYVARFINGEIFSNTYKKNKPFTFTIGKHELIEGLEYGLLSMKVGGKALIIIPSKMAYGAEGKKPVPPNTTILFETELINVE